MLNARKTAGAAAVAGLVALAATTPVRSADNPLDAKMDGRPAKTARDLYPLCAFYPKPGTCEDVYRYALRDNDISAQAVRAEYEGYVRYLGGEAPLTEADRQYLRQNGIRIPDGLSAANQAGLHTVINDPGLSAGMRSVAVNNFLSRAVEAELYCGFNRCDTETASAANMAAR